MSATTFDFTGDEQTYQVPAGTRQIDVELWGANGGASNPEKTGYGGYVRTRLFVQENSTLYVYPGQAGNGTEGGFGFDKANGGDASLIETSEEVFGGGAGSFILADPLAPITDALVVVGGGGGAGLSKTVIVGGPTTYQRHRGGFGGGYRGFNGFPYQSAVAGEGAVAEVPGDGGQPNGSAGEDGNGGTPINEAFAGGGGGGIGGGGSGGQTTDGDNFVSGAGGGGSGGVPGCCIAGQTLVNVQFNNVNYNATGNPNTFGNGNGYIIITPVKTFPVYAGCTFNPNVNLANWQITQQFRTFNRNAPRPVGSGYNSTC